MVSPIQGISGGQSPLKSLEDSINPQKTYNSIRVDVKSREVFDDLELKSSSVVRDSKNQKVARAFERPLVNSLKKSLGRGTKVAEEVFKAVNIDAVASFVAFTSVYATVYEGFVNYF